MGINYTVKQGDCISSIAFEHGFFPETIWNNENNAELKRKRKDLNVLMPGDVVFIPDKRLKVVTEPTDQVYKFRYKAASAKLNLKLLRDDEPLSNQPFVLEIEGNLIEGVTDNEGKIRVPVVPNAGTGTLKVGTAPNEIEYVLDLGWLDPIDQISGVKKRLHNLGYEVGVMDQRVSAELREAIMEFEFDQNLEQIGQVTDRLRARLKEVYGF